MTRKRILIVCLILNLLFIWGNSLLSREVSARLSDRVMDVMNAAAEKLGLGPDLFTVHIDEDGDGEPDPTSLLVRKIALLSEFACLGALLRLLADERPGPRRAACSTPRRQPPRTRRCSCSPTEAPFFATCC